MNQWNLEPRPKTVPNFTKRNRLTCGNLYTTITHQDGKVLEVFATMGKAGGCTSACLDALCITLSLALRRGMEPNLFIEYLKGISCPSVSIDEGVTYPSCIDAIAQFMEETQKELSEGKYVPNITTI